jgi:hypothetical protein
LWQRFCGSVDTSADWPCEPLAPADGKKQFPQNNPGASMIELRERPQLKLA